MVGNPYRQVTSLQHIVVALVATLLGVSLLGVSVAWLEEHKTLGTLVNQVGSLIIASVALGFLWELVGRRSFLREVLELLRLKNDVSDAGLQSIGTDYQQVIDWDERLESAKQLDVFAAWATTWRNNQLGHLTRLAARGDAKIRVFLPDADDAECVRNLGTRFNLDIEGVTSKINDAIVGYKKLDNGAASGRVEIYTTSVFRAFTAYRIDDQFVVTLYHHMGDRSPSFPSMSCRRGGSLYTFFEKDLEGVLNGSKRIYPHVG